MRRLGLLLALVIAAGCRHGALDDGFAIDLTITADASLPASTLARIQTLDFTVTGDESAKMTFFVTKLATDRQERVIYRPAKTQGTLAFTVVARDDAMGIAGYGTGTVDIKSGKTAALTIALTSMIPGGILEVAPATLDFGRVGTGASSGRTVVTVTNAGGSATGAIAATFSGDDAGAFAVDTDLCTGQMLDVGATCTIALKFTPTDARAFAATLTLAASPGGSVDVPLGGTGTMPGALHADAARHDFGSVVVGQSSSDVPVTITNTGGVDSGAIAVTLSGQDLAMFAVVADDCTGMTLAPSATCSFKVHFSPTATGERSASLSIDAMPGGSATVALTGTAVGVAQLQVTSAPPNFGSIVIGNYATQIVTISNQGGTDTGALTAVLSGTNAGEFALQTDGCTGQPLAPAGSCMVTVRFTPATVGMKSATLKVSGTPGGTAMASLTGVGLTPGSLSISPSMPMLGPVLIGGTPLDTAFIVTNNGGGATGQIATMLTGSDTSQYSVLNDGCGGSVLPAGGTCTITLRFAPTSSGTKSVSLQVSATPGGNATASVSGVAQKAAQLQAMPGTSASFGTVNVGAASTTVTFTVTNVGDQGASAITSQASGSTADFAVTNGCDGMALAGGAQCTITAQLKPQSYGSKSATLTLTSSGGTLTFTFSGVGQDTVTLTLTTPGDGTGTLSATGQTSCTTGPCTWTFTRNATTQTVAIDATPAANADFIGWGGDCASFGTGTSCTLSMSAAHSASATFNLKRVTLTVTKPPIDGAGGTVTANVGGISCGTTCSGNVPIGSTVTLTATPTGSAVFQGWFGDCSGNQTTCTFTQNGAANVGATFLTTHHNYVFVTRATFDGALGGLAGADTKCQAAASGAGLTGTWRAWLATSTATAQSRFASARGWVRRDGQPFADTAASIMSPTYQVYHPVRLDERGTDLPNESPPWTGTDQTGAASLYNGKYWTCGDWTSNASTDYAEAGDVLGGSGSWSFTGGETCQVSIPIYCFQTDYSAPLTFTKASGRVAFLSQGLFDPSKGLANADSLCQGEAAAASLPGTYKALLSTTTASAASRFSTAGAPWVRIDGVALSDTAANLFKPNALAALNQCTNGTYVWDQIAWTGNTDPLSPGTRTCKDWTSNASTDIGNIGDASYASQVMMFGTSGYYCNNTEHLYCLQQ